MTRFEGTEKKLELFVSEDIKSLRHLDISLWKNVVKKSKSQILSSMQNDYCIAYLLSESSLFIYDHFMTMITCGNTSLVDATLEILNFIPKDHILSFFYERKNPIFPTDQSTNFYEDAKRLKNHFNATAYRFGDLTEHHICLFCKDIETTTLNLKDMTPEMLLHNNKMSPFLLYLQDMTLELLMHEIDDTIKNVFSSSQLDAEIKTAFQSLGLYDIFPNKFQIDDHIFKPYGYSLNAIRENEYYTFHISPGDLGSYVSFETNHFFTNDYQATIEKILDIFKPKLFDIFQFQIQHTPCLNHLYLPKRKVCKKLNFGYDIQFYNFYKKQSQALEPFKISLK